MPSYHIDRDQKYFFQKKKIEGKISTQCLKIESKMSHLFQNTRLFF